VLERMQALSFGVARRWCGRAHATKIHACRETGFRHDQLNDALIGNGIGSGPGDGDGGRGRGGNRSGDGDGNSVCAFIFSIRFHPLSYMGPTGRSDMTHRSDPICRMAIVCATKPECLCADAQKNNCQSG